VIMVFARRNIERPLTSPNSLKLMKN